LLRQALDNTQASLGESAPASFDSGSALFALIFEEHNWLSQLLVQVLVEQGRYEEALEVSELGKARVTSTMMSRPKRVDTTTVVCGRLVDLLSQMPLEQLDRLEEHYVDAGRIPNHPLFKSGQCDFARVMELARRNSEGLNVNEVKPLGIEDMRQIAQEKKATIVEYSIISQQPFGKMTRTEDELFIWVINPEGKVTFKRTLLGAGDSPPALSTLVFNWRCFENEACKVEETAQLNRGDSPSFNLQGQKALLNQDALQQAAPRSSNQEDLKRLYQLLIKPIEKELPRNDSHGRVIIIPEQSLFLLPFAALIDSEGQYLIEKYPLSMASSLETLKLAAQKSRPLDLTSLARNDSLIIGNPKMPAMGEEAPVQLRPLPGAEKEAEAVASLLNASATTNSEATKEFVLSRLSSAKIVHLATHGILEDLTNVGLPGALALTPNGDNTGWLTANEIMDLDLQSQLTVLSACNTGNGAINGDGVIGLSRSFILGGSPSVVVSLWKVPDRPTEFLMTAFYQQLKAGQAKDAALRLAMLETMAQYEDPVKWAGFILIGDSEFASHPEP
jgi:CHAT domain-containing protein